MKDHINKGANVIINKASKIRWYKKSQVLEKNIWLQVNETSAEQILKDVHLAIYVE